MKTFIKLYAATLSIVMLNSFVQCADTRTFRETYNNPEHPVHYVALRDLTTLASKKGAELEKFTQLQNAQPGEEYNHETVCTQQTENCILCKIGRNGDSMYIEDINGNNSERRAISIASAGPVEPGQIVVFLDKHTPTTSNVTPEEWQTIAERMRIYGYLLQGAPFNHAGIEIGSNCGPTEHSGASQPAHAHWQIIPYSSQDVSTNHAAAWAYAGTLQQQQIDFSKQFKTRLEHFMDNEYHPHNQPVSPVTRIARALFSQPTKYTKLLSESQELDGRNLIIARNRDHTIIWALDPQSSAHVQVVANNQHDNPLNINNAYTQQQWLNMTNSTRCLQFLLRKLFCANATDVASRYGTNVHGAYHSVIDIIANDGANSQGFPNKGQGGRHMLLVNPSTFCQRMAVAYNENKGHFGIK